jgi:4-hydroxy-3-methylbut-2-enyl diphosphate reductase IspH
MVYLIICNVLWLVVTLLAYRKGYIAGLDRAVEVVEKKTKL